MGLDADAELRVEAGEVELARDHADRAGQRAAFDEHFFAGHGDVVTARGRDIAKADDQRLLAGQFFEFAADEIGAGGAAARAGDAQHDGLGVFVARQTPQQFDVRRRAEDAARGIAAPFADRAGQMHECDDRGADQHGARVNAPRVHPPVMAARNQPRVFDFQFLQHFVAVADALDQPGFERTRRRVGRAVDELADLRRRLAQRFGEIGDHLRVQIVEQAVGHFARRLARAGAGEGFRRAFEFARDEQVGLDRRLVQQAAEIGHFHVQTGRRKQAGGRDPTLLAARGEQELARAGVFDQRRGFLAGGPQPVERAADFLRARQAHAARADAADHRFDFAVARGEVEQLKQLAVRQALATSPVERRTRKPMLGERAAEVDLDCVVRGAAQKHAGEP